MKDNWLNHNTDKILLFALVLVLLCVTVHIAHHDAGDMEAVTWSEGSFSTVLGALILILTGRIGRADGQTASGLPPNMPAADLPPVGTTKTVIVENKENK